ncbi:MAG: trypsin-like peptidase domain-containing protein [Ruminococcus sp.]|nr:trypsin-like peptidase domain-containing protein [Ruminococcus sp.]
MDQRDNVFNELQKNQPEETNTPQTPEPSQASENAAAQENRRNIQQTQYNSAQQQFRQGAYDQAQQQYNANQQFNQERQYEQYRNQFSPNPPPSRMNGYYNNPYYGAGSYPNAEQLRAAAELKEKNQRIRREKTIVALFFILVLAALIMGITGIVYDIATSGKRLRGAGTANQVVIYQNSKPEGADDNISEPDENGRYSTEGAAAAVRKSIVEIYTYSDAFQKDLEGTGSGVVLNEQGYIVTNAHVLSATGYHDVHTADGKVYSASVVGRDSKTDIAVLKINASDLVPAVLGNSDEVIVGEEVIAIGNPAGLTGTVTNGIVSAVNREIRSDSTGFEMNCIQTNAAISPGNSGGALVNMYGQVIGITSSKYVSGFYEGLGFAITINEAKPIIEELINNGFIGGRFRIGITLIDMSSEENVATIESNLGFELPEDFKGIYIDDISEDCDISKTALKKGDFITKINGTPIETYDEMYDTISASYGAGDTVPAECAHVRKDGSIKEYEIEFKLMEDTSGDY